MRIHPQLVRTVHLLERLRATGKRQRLIVAFGPRGLEGALVEAAAESAPNDKITLDLQGLKS